MRKTLRLDKGNRLTQRPRRCFHIGDNPAAADKVAPNLKLRLEQNNRIGPLGTQRQWRARLGL